MWTLPAQVLNTISVKTCPRCGHQDLHSRNVTEHSGVNGPFLSYALYCLRCETIVGSATSPKEIPSTPIEKTVRERKPTRTRTPKPSTQKGLF